MPYSIAIGSIQVLPESALTRARPYTCTQAQKACMPSFVFSITGQVGFRAALDHLSTCKKRDCASLRKKVKDGMYAKLKWLFTEEALLGCLPIQPLLYRSKTVIDVRTNRNFITVANHLAHCPSDACARLRRSLLLTVRDNVSPNSRDA